MSSADRVRGFIAARRAALRRDPHLFSSNPEELDAVLRLLDELEEVVDNRTTPIPLSRSQFELSEGYGPGGFFARYQESGPSYKLPMEEVTSLFLEHLDAYDRYRHHYSIVADLGQHSTEEALRARIVGFFKKNPEMSIENLFPLIYETETEEGPVTSFTGWIVEPPLEARETVEADRLERLRSRLSEEPKAVSASSTISKA